jgi:hypothetical protein
LIITIIFFFTITLVEESQAQLTLPAMYGNLTVNATVFNNNTPVEGYPQTEQFTGTGSSFTASLALDAAYFLQYSDAESPAYDMEFTGNLVASGGSMSTSAHLNGVVNMLGRPSSQSQTGAASVEGYLYYYYGVAGSPQLPPGTLIPLTVSVQGEASGDAGGGGGRCSILAYDYYDVHSADTDSGSPGFSTTWTLWIEPDIAYQIRMYGRVAAGIYSSYNETESYGAQFSVDPVFKFDQASFDALMGDDTFPLKDYLAISFSEGIDSIGNTNPIINPPTTTTRSILAILMLLLDE